MKTYPVLFSRTSTGAVQTWQMETDGTGRYRSISGQQDGVKTTAEWTVAKPKNVGKANETSAVIQSELEVEAKYKKQLKTGYFESIDDIDQSIYVEPMLAKNFKDRKGKVTYPVFCDRKYNGMRQITTKRGAHTRKGEEILSAPHIVEDLKELFANHPDLVLDGELYNENLANKLNELISLVRRTKNITAEHLAASKELVKYYLYDGYGFNGITQKTKYSERKKALAVLLSGFKTVIVVPNVLANNEAEVMAAYEKYVAEGYEGAIVRIDGEYQNKRSENLLKVKPLDSAEFTIVDVEEGEGNRTGMAGRVILRLDDGRTFAANLKGNEAQFAEVLAHKTNYIGKSVTIFFNGFTGYEIPNYAQFDCSNYNSGDR